MANNLLGLGPLINNALIETDPNYRRRAQTNMAFEELKNSLPDAPIPDKPGLTELILKALSDAANTYGGRPTTQAVDTVEGYDKEVKQADAENRGRDRQLAVMRAQKDLELSGQEAEQMIRKLERDETFRRQLELEVAKGGGEFLDEEGHVRRDVDGNVIALRDQVREERLSTTLDSLNSLGLTPEQIARRDRILDDDSLTAPQKRQRISNLVAEVKSQQDATTRQQQKDIANIQVSNRSPKRTKVEDARTDAANAGVNLSILPEDILNNPGELEKLRSVHKGLSAKEKQLQAQRVEIAQGELDTFEAALFSRLQSGQLTHDGAIALIEEFDQRLQRRRTMTTADGEPMTWPALKGTYYLEVQQRLEQIFTEIQAERPAERDPRMDRLVPSHSNASDAAARVRSVQANPLTRTQE